jgi:hypothetical protein
MSQSNAGNPRKILASKAAKLLLLRAWRSDTGGKHSKHSFFVVCIVITCDVADKL